MFDRFRLEEALGGRSAMDAVASIDGVDELLTVLGTGGQRWETVMLLPVGATRTPRTHPGGIA